MEAVHLKRFDMVQLLLEKGAEVDRTDNKGRTPLAVAFSGAVNDSIVEALVKFGAEINSADRDGRTPISYAISMGAVGAADALYRAGAKIDFSLSDGSTVLHMAPNIQTIRWLMTVGNGVNPNAVDKLGRTTLNLELQKKPPGIDKCLALMECFPDTLDIFLPDASGKSPVAVAKKKGKLDILSHFASQKPETAVRFLLEASKAGATGLSVPSSILELPDDRRREVLRIRDDSGCTALHWACKSRNSALVKALLEAGADVNTRDSSNRTPLHFVCGAEAQQVTSRFLLSSLADRLINLKALMGTDSGSNTPAVSQKAEVDVVDSQGYTALSYAIRAGFDDLAVELLNYGAAVLPSTFDSSSPKSAEMLRNPLGIAVAVNSPLIPTLLKHGDLINRADPTTGNTPLLELLLKSIMPASPADIELVRSLVEAGADVHAERKDGVRASELLRKRIPPSSPIIYMLMEKGVDVNGPATASDTLVSNAFAAEPAAPAFSPSLFSTSNQKSPFGGGKFVNPFAGFTESLQNAGLLGAPPADLFAVPNPFDAIASPAVPQPQQQPAAQQQQANPFGQQPQPQAVIPPLFGVLQFGHTQDANQQQQQPQMQQNPVNPFASLYPPQNLFG
jgi:ankyrin repeat protein